MNLTAEAIDTISEEIGKALQRANSPRKDTLKARIAVEEALLRYRDVFGEGQKVVLSTTMRFGRVHCALRLPGERMNPFADAEGNDDIPLRDMLSEVNVMIPAWRYYNGANVIEVRSPSKDNPPVSVILISMLAAIAITFLSRFLSQDLVDSIVGTVVSPIFNTFTSFLSAVATPMIFFSVLYGICGMGDLSTFGKIGKKVMARFLLGMLCAASISVLLMNPFFESGKDVVNQSNAVEDIWNMLLDIVPDNLFQPFLDGNCIQVIFWALLLALGMLMLGKRVENLNAVIEQTNRLFLRVMGLITKILPAFIFISLLKVCLETGFTYLAGFIKLIGVYLIFVVAWCALYTLRVCTRFRISPLLYIRKILSGFLVALTTASSGTALATNLECCDKKLGIDEKFSRFSLPLGQIFYQINLCISFSAVAYGFAEIYGVAVTPSWMLMAIITIFLLSIASPPIPGGSLAAYSILMVQLGLPLEAVSIAAAIDVFFDMIGTAFKVYAIMAETTILSDSLDCINRDVLRKSM